MGHCPLRQITRGSRVKHIFLYSKKSTVNTPHQFLIHIQYVNIYICNNSNMYYVYIYIYRHSLSSFLLTLWQGCKVPGPKVYYRLVSFWICFLQAAADPSNLRPLEPGQALYQSASQDQAILAHSHLQHFKSRRPKRRWGTYSQLISALKCASDAVARKKEKFEPENGPLRRH